MATIDFVHHPQPRAVVTYQDAEAILHECLQMQEHLGAQDRALNGIVSRTEELQKRMAG